MSEEIKEELKEETQLAEEKALLKEYQKLKENSVSKEQYEKDIAELKEKNRIYLQAITEGEELNVATSENSDSIEDAIADISKFKGTNLEYWQKMTNTVDKVLKTLPDSEITKITGSEGLEEIIKVNEFMKGIVKESDGDCDTFRSLYKKNVVDSAPRISAEIEKFGGLVGYFNNKK